MRVRPAFFALALLVGGMLAPLTASAIDVQACLNASERGQRARSDGKLREARQQFLICEGEGCPAMVRRDCAQWQTDVDRLLPTVVFGANDSQGRDLLDVSVSIDSEAPAKLDGKSVAVDPGPHTFTFASPGRAAVVERALVKEGERSRVISVSFGEPRDEVKRPPDGTAPRGHTLLPWLMVGVGVATVAVGVVYAVTAPSLPPNCDPNTTTCTKTAGESAEQFSTNQSDAGEHDARPRLGLIIGGVGLSLAVAGLLWHFLEPTGERSAASLHITPWASGSGAGGSFGGAF